MINPSWYRLLNKFRVNTSLDFSQNERVFYFLFGTFSFCSSLHLLSLKTSKVHQYPKLSTVKILCKCICWHYCPCFDLENTEESRWPIVNVRSLPPFPYSPEVFLQYVSSHETFWKYLIKNFSWNTSFI